MELPLRYYGDPFLRKRAVLVEKITDEIRTLVQNMIETMDLKNGVGLAANQVGEPYAIFVIRPEVQDENGEFALGPPEVFINPVLSKPSAERDIMAEGCLSIPGLSADVERPVSIHLEALDINGKKISLDLTGFKAREVMHENDHLNGRFYTDRVSDEIKRQIEPTLKEIKKKYNK